ncbi:AMP-binding protein [Chelativorans sp. ZYF759]|uniref:class I adenylate-forming enzyme family protein n=1 Tax=Chelativorans sp. ZYF759 TaxID=2692213 RepID=UPI00145F8D44|nr:AMP-binding protein [Chelativorans sp. ZYF759]NMG41702.1 AMP-binding protein [Chelativorans sp. ZYF759]
MTAHHSVDAPAYVPVREDTLAGLLVSRAADMPDFVFAIFPDESATFRQLHDKAESLAKGLIATGLKPRDHVAILMPNCLDYMIAHFAVQMAGGVSVLPNARYKSHELRHVIGHSDARFLITTSRFDDAVNFAEVLTQTFPQLADANASERLRLNEAPLLERIILFGDRNWKAVTSVDDIVALGRGVDSGALAAARAWQRPEDTAVMYYTSGTTSMPKACMMSHVSFQRSWSIFARTVGLRRGEKVWVPMPFFHSGGMGLTTGLMAHGAAIASAPHFDPEATLDMIERHRIDILYPGFHLLAAPVLGSPRFDKARFDFVRALVVIGPLGTTRQLQALLPNNAPALNLYGMSEAAGLITLAPFDAANDVRLTVAGKPLAGIEVRICDVETGAVLDDGAAGEIHFRGGGAFNGYYKDAIETAGTILPDGWVRTGDHGRIDGDGYLWFLGRLKDMLRIGGENVAAAEIESFLSAHPAVRNVQVVGRPDDRLGETPVAFIELEPEQAVSDSELIDFCTGKIARYKIPREVIFVTEWPMSATKIQKFKLKELLPPLPREAGIA